MKDMRSAMQFIAIGCLLSLTACIPIQPKYYRSPTNFSGKNCVQQCYKQQQTCDDLRCTRDNSCGSSQRLAIDLQDMRDPAGSFYTDDPFTSSNDFTDCSDEYEDCFTECGGTVGFQTMNKKPAELLLHSAFAVALMLLTHEKNN